MDLDFTFKNPISEIEKNYIFRKVKYINKK